ncbi:NAD-dependent dehydratase [bacterium (Candidatus Torokbacteria) CG09_land_8_20_14_0_10_42_11]|nr:MAG: NAD-dependent dehydratase [bacterium (Candidatus Torokbacteria) CG09_land_8_20_14_0_10_42_11]
MPTKKTILVTGGAGFIGSNLIRRLLSEKHKIICVDNLITGSYENIRDWLASPDFIFIDHDITETMPALPDKIDQIYNLACPASPVDFPRYPIKILKVCSNGVNNMLDLAMENQAAILHASTSEIYGDPQVHPQKESYRGYVNTLGVRSCYDEGKRFAESLISSYIRKYKVKAKMVRIFNTYGPGMRANDGRVMPNFINQAMENKPITVYGQGEQTRSFSYVDDLVSGLIKMMESDEIGPFNLGNPVETKISDLAAKIVKLTGSQSRIEFRPLPQDDPTKRKPDITLAREKLGWEPKVNLNEGLKKTIEYFKKLQKL